MNLKLTADYIHDGIEGFKRHHILIVDHQYKILDFYQGSEVELKECIYYPGLLTPGFVNAHCHLELSHLRGKFQTGTKLIPFLKNVVSTRDEEKEAIQKAIVEADQEMYREGIVAVGDISNKSDTIDVKKISKLKYYTFIEAFDFLQNSLTESLFGNYAEVYKSYGDLPKSMVAHAAYSVTPGLFKKIAAINNTQNSIMSVHNQESEDDDLLFLSKSGGFPDFWESFGFSMSAFEANGMDSVNYLMDHLTKDRPVLFVHNTRSEKHHIERLMKWNTQSYFVTCPNANLFIENALPNYKNFIEMGATIAIGTDSLSSNWKLSILSELQTLLKFNAWLNLETVLKWATYNGAKALGMDAHMGSIQKHKTPGINWIQEVYENAGSLKINETARVHKIF
ncbi:MAG: amidohydrolase family protein [Saprospiraceae bacterium]|nr:amidohydrolase family protein [Saprospiraceae bacterium]